MDVPDLYEDKAKCGNQDLFQKSCKCPHYYVDYNEFLYAYAIKNIPSVDNQTKKNYNNKDVIQCESNTLIIGLF